VVTDPQTNTHAQTHKHTDRTDYNTLRRSLARSVAHLEVGRAYFLSLMSHYLSHKYGHSHKTPTQVNESALCSTLGDIVRHSRPMYYTATVQFFVLLWCKLHVMRYNRAACSRRQMNVMRPEESRGRVVDIDTVNQLPIRCRHTIDEADELTINVDGGRTRAFNTLANGSDSNVL